MSRPPLTAVLGLDQAAHTGWGIALVTRGAPRVVAHGMVRNDSQDGDKCFAEHRAVGERAAELAGGAAHLLVLREYHGGMPLSRLTRDDRDTRRSGRSGRPERSTDSILGLGGAWGYWVAVLDSLGHPRRLRLSVAPQDWRARVLSPRRGASEVELKQLAIQWASCHVRQSITDADQAEGIAITAFAARDGMDLLEQRRLKQRLYARGRREERRQMVLGEAKP